MKEVVSTKSGERFAIYPLEETLLDRISPVINDQKFSLPLPTTSLHERLRSRLAFRNERHLYWRKCDFTKKDILSVHHSEKPFPVYSMEAWWSDNWDPLSYGRDFDFSRPFFDQFSELMKAVPRLAMSNKNPTNSDYVSIGSDNKNCYLCSASTANEDSLYSGAIYLCKNVVDNYMLLKSEVCYDSVHCDNCYQAFFSRDCSNCAEIFFSEDCFSCTSCFGCFGLRNKSFCWFNEQLSQEEYKNRFAVKMRDLSRDKVAQYKKEFAQFAATVPHRPLTLKNAENCLGDYLNDSQNCANCFDLDDAQDCANVVRIARRIRDSVDACEGADGVELCFNVMSVGLNLYHAICSMFVWGCRDVTYCDHCFSVEDCFGCVGLRNHARYCIFNKQYSKEEYEVLVPKIIAHMRQTGEWGKFFPAQLSPFGYNETLAAILYPTDKDRAIADGFKWSDYESPVADMPALKADALPQSISEVTDAILNQVIICKTSGKRFRITKQELDFYRQHNLPLPDEQPEIRYINRIQARHPRHFYSRVCPSDGKEFFSTTPTTSPNIVYCQECYQKQYS